MSKRIHLLCNAHIDPVWQWEWEEGAAETLSTFRIAADFCEEYDDFVFCHNEALLYRWIEEYDPPLFSRIQGLVAQGKWNILGGWHLQPDCNMPSGEAFVRQIFSGRQYFKEKFGVIPKVAFNADPFGHTRGLVQIMAKSGYEGYLFMRPWPEFLELPDNDFRWVGYDGSSVIGIRMIDGYSSFKGRALEKIQRFEETCPDKDFILCLWGIGNHGGGPSKEDLEAITAHKSTLTEDIELIHSTAEDYLREVKEKRNLSDVTVSLNPWAPGCYTTMISIKQKYRQAENTLFMTEKLCAHAACAGLMEYPHKEFQDAIYDIIAMQFHDILPGTSIQPSEDMAHRYLDHALEILSRLKARAFFSLCAGQEKAEADAIPIMIYNPFPYPIEDDFFCEFNLWDQVRDPVFLQPTVYHDGIAIPTQCEKEGSSIPMQWRKRVVFHATLQPMRVNRFDCKFTVLPARPDRILAENNTHYIFDNATEHIEISKSTGWIDHYSKNGKAILSKDAFRLDVFADDYDPWGMMIRGWGQKIGEFSLLSDVESAHFACLDKPLSSVHVTEDGDVRSVVEAFFGYGDSKAVVNYTMSKTTGMQITLRMHWNEKQKLLKMHIPAAFDIQKTIGDRAYGSEPLCNGIGEESCIQKYVAVLGDDYGFSLANSGTYGISYDNEHNIIYPTLMRSPSFCAHPFEDRTVVPQDRFCPYIDQGERIFRFDFMADTANAVAENASRKAQIFNEGFMAISFYPAGTKEIPESGLSLSGSSAITLTAFKKAEIGNGYILRFFNSIGSIEMCSISGFGQTTELTLSPYEIRTLRLTDNGFEDADLMEGLLG